MSKNKIGNLAIHSSAKSSHYDEAAKDYDHYNEEHSKLINKTLEKILKKYNVKTVLDLTCGTGSQVFWLNRRGYEVTGADINLKMLNVAKSKTRKNKWNITFIRGDMRTLRAGEFDSVITIFNAVGHLTKTDFLKSMKNIGRNLRKGGLYIFDICNLNYLIHEDHITRLTIDWQKTVGNKKIRTIQYSTIDASGVLASYTTSYEQEGSGKARLFNSSQTLQVYTAKELDEMLSKAGFRTLGHYGIDGSRFMDAGTERILTIAKRI